MSAFQVTVSGSAVVCCVHDRVKREIVDLEVDLRYAKPHLCVCCENLFAERTDTPMLCPQCRGGLVHKLEAPLPEPKGVVG